MGYNSIGLNMGAQSRQFVYRPETSDEGVIQQIFCYQDYALNKLSRFNDLVEYGQTRLNLGIYPLIVDAGANIGASAVYFALNFPSSKIVAIEPSQDNFALLTRNTTNLRVEPVLGALSAKHGFVNLVDAGEGYWGYRTEPALVNAGIPTVTVNDIFSSNSLNYFPFIVKIDIEGGEKDLFSSNVEWVARTPLIIIELHDWLLPKGGSSNAFLRCIASLDRDFVHIGENIFSIANNL